MTSNITRRQVARTAAWAAPAVALSTAAPASAASNPKPKPKPACKEWPQWQIRYDKPGYVGIDGFLGTVSFWIVVAPGQRPRNGCSTPTPVTSYTTTIDVIRQEGGLKRYRSTTFGQGNPFKRTVHKSLRPDRLNEFPPGTIDHQWKVTYNPQDIYSLNPQHRAYVTLHPGDGGFSGGRIKNKLALDNTIQTFFDQGDQTF